MKKRTVSQTAFSALAPVVLRTSTLPHSISHARTNTQQCRKVRRCTLLHLRDTKARAKASSLQASAAVNHSTSDDGGDGPMLLLVDHGSERAAANEMLADVADMLRARTDLPVHTAHMELATPTIADGIDACVRAGARHIIVIPFFLSPGRHSTTDIPRMTAEAVSKHTGITYDVRPPIGTHPGIVDVILDRAGLLKAVQN